MRIVRKRNVLLAFVALIVSLSLQSPLAAYVTRPESQQLTQLLSDANDEALQLVNDAEETQTLILSDSNWVTHTLALARVKGHVDNMALIIEKLSKTQKSGSELQEQAVERMLPLVKELSTNTTDAINYLNQNKDRPVSDAYTQYLRKNTDTARQLSSMISSLLKYQESMTEIEKLRSKLVVSGSPTP